MVVWVTHVVNNFNFVILFAQVVIFCSTVFFFLSQRATFEACSRYKGYFCAKGKVREKRRFEISKFEIFHL